MSSRFISNIVLGLAGLLPVVRLIFSSGTNALLDGTTAHITERADVDAAAAGIVGAPR